MTFRTARTVVRRLVRDDVDALLAVYGDADGMRWVGAGQPLDRAACERWVEVTDRNLALRGYGMATVTWAETGAAIGFCGLVHPDGQPEAELKYAFARDWWGRGLATEVAAGVLRYGVEQLGLRAVIATVAPGNAASRRVLEKVGLVRRADRIHDDGTATIVYGTAG